MPLVKRRISKCTSDINTMWTRVYCSILLYRVIQTDSSDFKMNLCWKLQIKSDKRYMNQTKNCPKFSLSSYKCSVTFLSYANNVETIIEFRPYSFQTPQ